MEWEREGSTRPAGFGTGWGGGSIGGHGGSGSRYDKRFSGSSWGAGASSGQRRWSYDRQESAPARPARPSGSYAEDAQLTVPGRSGPRTRVQPQKEIISLSPGDTVQHASFGQGTVLSLEGTGDKTVAKVTFDGTEKRLLLRYAPLTKVD